MSTSTKVRSLINRLARIDAAETWGFDLNPAQIAALDYLARANRFSRTPSHVAAYLDTTRGTISQTLKSLVRKGYVSERRSENDRRSITYDLSEKGMELMDRQSGFEHAIESLSALDLERLADGLSALLKVQLTAKGSRSFGICNACKYHRTNAKGAICTLLSVPLAPAETGLLCHEQVAA